MHKLNKNQPIQVHVCCLQAFMNLFVTEFRYLLVCNSVSTCVSICASLNLHICGCKLRLEWVTKYDFKRKPAANGKQFSFPPKTQHFHPYKKEEHLHCRM